MAYDRNKLGCGAAILLLVLAVGIFFFNAWLFMLVFGGIHSGWAAFPALSYWTSVLFTLFLAFVGSYFKNHNKD